MHIPSLFYLFFPEFESHQLALQQQFLKFFLLQMGLVIKFDFILSSKNALSFQPKELLQFIPFRFDDHILRLDSHLKLFSRLTINKRRPQHSIQNLIQAIRSFVQ
ncbi:hypothetical protein Ancab_024447 [Ancistrocladus abbreviatus]